MEYRPPDPPPPAPIRPSSMNWLKVLGIVVVASLLSSLLAVLLIKTFLFPDRFTPVVLQPQEERQLAAKLEALSPRQESPILPRRLPSSEDGQLLTPEPYSEVDADREITLTERELNALLAKNTNLAQRLVIDLSRDLASAKLLIPLDEEFPIFGGQTLKVTAGLGLAYANGRPVVVLKGISLWGVPVPNAWLGNLKNVDLVQEFGGEKGFWQAFADGVEAIEIGEGHLRVRLKE